MGEAVTTVRRRNLLHQLSLHGQQTLGNGQIGTLQTFAELIGVHPSLLSKFKGQGASSRDISAAMARQIEARLGLVAGWMDEAHDHEALTSAEVSFLEMALQAYRAVNAQQRRALRKQFKELLEVD